LAGLIKSPCPISTYAQLENQIARLSATTQVPMEKYTPLIRNMAGLMTRAKTRVTTPPAKTPSHSGKW
jgi:hypothetical protein